MSGQDDRDNSSRLACGTVDNFGLSKDAIQIWLDVQQLINLGLTATYVRDGIEVQNRNITTGKLGQSGRAAEVAISRTLFAKILRLIGQLRPAPLPP